MWKPHAWSELINVVGDQSRAPSLLCTVADRYLPYTSLFALKLESKYYTATWNASGERLKCFGQDDWSGANSYWALTSAGYSSQYAIKHMPNVFVLKERTERQRINVLMSFRSWTATQSRKPWSYERKGQQILITWKVIRNLFDACSSQKNTTRKKISAFPLLLKSIKKGYMIYIFVTVCILLVNNY